MFIGLLMSSLLFSETKVYRYATISSNFNRIYVKIDQVEEIQKDIGIRYRYLDGATGFDWTCQIVLDGHVVTIKEECDDLIKKINSAQKGCK